MLHRGMVLFPIAFIWFIAVMIWLIRNSLNDPDVPREEREWRRWRPRPRRPQSPSRGPRLARMRSNSRS